MGITLELSRAREARTGRQTSRSQKASSRAAAVKTANHYWRGLKIMPGTLLALSVEALQSATDASESFAPAADLRDSAEV